MAVVPKKINFPPEGIDQPDINSDPKGILIDGIFIQLDDASRFITPFTELVIVNSEVAVRLELFQALNAKQFDLLSLFFDELPQDKLNYPKYKYINLLTKGESASAIETAISNDYTISNIDYRTLIVFHKHFNQNSEFLDKLFNQFGDLERLNSTSELIMYCKFFVEVDGIEQLSPLFLQKAIAKANTDFDLLLLAEFYSRYKKDNSTAEIFINSIKTPELNAFIGAWVAKCLFHMGKINLSKKILNSLAKNAKDTFDCIIIAKVWIEVFKNPIKATDLLST